MWNIYRQSKQGANRLALDSKVGALCLLALEAVGKRQQDYTILTKRLMSKFYSVLIGNSLKNQEAVRNSVKDNGEEEVELLGLNLKCQASEGSAMEQIQWKNNQKQVIADTLEQVIIMLIRNGKSCLKTIETTFEDITNTDPAALRKQMVQGCMTPTESPDRSCLKVRSTEKEFGFRLYHQDRGIKQQISEVSLSKQSVNSIEKQGLQKILELLRAERVNQCKLKERRRRCSDQLWECYGGLMQLQKEKFEDNFIFVKAELARDKILKELTVKNSANQKMIKKYKRKVQLQSSKKKICKERSLHSILPEMEEEEDRDEKENQVEKKDSVSLGLNLCKNGLQKSSKKLYTIRNKGKGGPANLSTSIPLSSQEIKVKVQSSFKEVKRYQSLGKNILNNIVFDPDSMLTSSKRRWIARSNERSFLHKFQKPHQTTNRLLLRVGGIRLSLQEMTFKCRGSLENA